jgi:hypothetical protein
MERAIALAQQFGLGCVALSNTNHWMRGGTLWLAGRGGWRDWYLLDQHDAQPAAVGSD